MEKKTEAKLLDIYDRMLEKNGHRHWWPSQSTFETVVGAILTQFVSWSNVVTAIDNLKREGLLSVEGICSVDEDKLGQLIYSTRFYKQKARKLKAFCRHLRDNCDGCLEAFLQKDSVTLRKELLSMYGIGKETADSIILYAAGKPVFVVDAYTLRIFSKLGIIEEKAAYDQVQKFFTSNLPLDVELYNDYHAQIVATGAGFCTGRRPGCNQCPVGPVCKSRGAV